MDNATWEKRPVLLLGASGSFAGALGLELMQRGRPLRALARDPAKLERRFGGAGRLEIVAGDAEDESVLIRAAAGCAVIVHAINYPYHLWKAHMDRVTANVVAAARAAGATILFPGNVYGLGPPRGAPFNEAAAMRPNTAKGALRVGLESEMAVAAETGDIRLLNLRAGDYFGPTARNAYIDRIFGNAAEGRPIEVFGRLDVPHQWAYLPDLARVAADLLDLGDRLAPVETVNFAGHLVPTTRVFLRDVARAAGHPDLAIRRIPWWLLRAAGLGSPLIREVVEMRYLFDEALILDDPRRRALLPDFKPTPLEDALRATIASYRSEALARAA
jgi:nucleoside-diphosphate-sugar epimerase